ncbi:gamma-glutamylcyclotransferase family protein [Natrarchaeobaculum sulfurireducens]|uniref:Gamma-glutamylcyclotransferase AIG2-like domain-containing protein n=1 Tax=Natrarchaeobaculum sulfurireducens TaxID=2044521 RepID=A0A346PTU0_9EURY|nr:gamma-glutamylcyclotransferase family protein [Natrarchaeobaculum sulfurireducens]AXR77099.1 hypothetical protein AArc1_0756 [Natrarchaeobaculum sulfurireducens]AXR82935.1 hypothetical protein AArcMg_2947 [Natrarchaeobaculum sulfurireducens]
MYVFVYGTLTDRERVDEVLEPDTDAFAGEATLEGFHRVDGRYPTLAPGGHVVGRLLEVDDYALRRLDRYESVDSGLYVRVTVPFDAERGEAAVYVGDPSRLGLEAVDWPAGPTLESQVRRYVAEAEPTLVRGA